MAEYEQAEQLWKEVAPTVDLANCASVAMASVACKIKGRVNTKVEKLNTRTRQNGRASVYMCTYLSQKVQLKQRCPKKRVI